MRRSSASAPTWRACWPSHAIIAEPVLGLIASGLGAAALGFATSFLVLRGSDLTRLMVTLGVALVLREIANRFDGLTGGADGLQGIVMAPLLGLFRFDISGHVAYAYSLAVAFLLFLLARRIVHSPFGLSLRAVKGNALRAAAIGIPVNRRLVAIYTIAAVYAGIAGALLTQTTQFASLEVFAFERSADVLLVLIIGGTGYLYGGLIGAILFKLMQDWLAALTPQYWQFWIGLVLVAHRAGRPRAHPRPGHCWSARSAMRLDRPRCVRAPRRERVADHGGRARDVRPAAKRFGGLVAASRRVAEGRAAARAMR